MPDTANNSLLLELTGSIVRAHVANNSVSHSDLPRLISSVYDTIAKLETPVGPEVPSLVPAVPIRNSIKPAYIVCLEDGKHFKSMKRHLMSSFGMTPDEYRAKWGLPADYPMVASNYSKSRSSMAKSFGLGVPKGKLGAR